MTGVTFARVLRFEWVKFWSLRSSWIVLALTAVVFVGTGLLASWLGFDADAEDVGAYDTIGISLTGGILAMLVAGVLGVLVTTGEYSTGTIRSTLAAVPRRLPMLAAKVVVFGTVSFALMLVCAVVAFAAGQAVIGDAGASFGDAGVVRAIVGNAAYVTGAGLLGLLLGSLLRSPAGALSTYFAVMFLLTVLSQLILSQSWREDIGKFLPSAAGEAMGAVIQPADALTPLQGALVFTGYLLLTGGLAGWRLLRTDAV